MPAKKARKGSKSSKRLSKPKNLESTKAPLVAVKTISWAHDD